MEIRYIFNLISSFHELYVTSADLHQCPSMCHPPEKGVLQSLNDEGQFNQPCHKAISHLQVHCIGYGSDVTSILFKVPLILAEFSALCYLLLIQVLCNLQITFIVLIAKCLYHHFTNFFHNT